MLVAKKYSKLIKIAFSLFVMTLAIFLLANFSFAAEPDLSLNQVGDVGLGQADLKTIIARIIRIFIGLLGVLTVILLIYAGFLWMTSGGEEEKVTRAKRIIKNAIIGLIIITLSYAIVSFILGIWTGGRGGGGAEPPGIDPGNIGLGALGNGIVQSHYPARNQKDVPRNTSIIVTFREAMKLDTLCSNSDANECRGAIAENLIADKVRIFKLIEHANCTKQTLDASCTSIVANARVYSTPDKKTFIFKPTEYLGSPSENINYAVYLTAGIKKANGGDAFAGSFGQGYEWKFEVSNKIDLTPPQVVSGGIFPAPDVAEDVLNILGAATQAAGRIMVKNLPGYQQDARVISIDNIAASPDIELTINKDCRLDGTIKVRLSPDPLIAQLFSPENVPLGQGTLGNKKIIFSECNLTLNTSADYQAGNGWDISIAKSVSADTLTVGNTVYTFISGLNNGGNNQIAIGERLFQLASNINRALANNREVTSRLNRGFGVDLAAIEWGTTGNNINLVASNLQGLVPKPFEITLMSGGRDSSESMSVKGRSDKPMNATIQINFNEAIMPLTVVGTAAQVKDYIRVVNAHVNAKAAGQPCLRDGQCKSFKCQERVCVGDNDYLEGKFEISNQYTTVGFVPDKECGFNSCGEKIYCLPKDSHLRVEFEAASLTRCVSGADCITSAPYTACVGNICQKTDSTKYPLSAMPLTGVADTAMNSLDGNRDADADGPDNGANSNYNENDIYGLCLNGANKDRQCSDADKVAICGPSIRCVYADNQDVMTLTQAKAKGDNFQWSFFINDQLDTASPKITLIDPSVNQIRFETTKRVLMHFNKYMMSSTLNTGSVTIVNGRNEKIHQLLNLRAYATEPLAYWITNQGTEAGVPDGEYDQTDVFIEHSDFSSSARYRAQAGSGLKDVYQNCYMPASGPDCAATIASPSCCNGAITAGSTCQ